MQLLLTFLTNPGDDFIQPINISRAAVTNSVADAGQCRVTSTATGGISTCNEYMNNNTRDVQKFIT